VEFWRRTGGVLGQEQIQNQWRVVFSDGKEPPLGYPELGSVSIAELEGVRGGLRLPIERDEHFIPTKTLSAYADDASKAGAIQA